MPDSSKSRYAHSDRNGSEKINKRNIIVPKRPLEIVEYISKEDALLEAEIQRLEQELVEMWGHK